MFPKGTILPLAGVKIYIQWEIRCSHSGVVEHCLHFQGQNNLYSDCLTLNMAVLNFLKIPVTLYH